MGFMIQKGDYYNFFQIIFWIAVIFELVLVLCAFINSYKAKRSSEIMTAQFYIQLSIINLGVLILYLIILTY